MNFWSQPPATPPPTAAAAALTWEQAWHPLLYATTALLAGVVAYKFIWEFLKFLVGTLAVIGAITVWARWKALIAALNAAATWAADYLSTTELLQQPAGQQQQTLWRVLFN